MPNILVGTAFSTVPADWDVKYVVGISSDNYTAIIALSLSLNLNVQKMLGNSENCTKAMAFWITQCYNICNPKNIAF